MPIRDFGAVCDISVLTDRASLDEAQELFSNSGLYIPASTYSWLSRSKLIQVRHQTVKYSLLSQMVRSRKIYPTHLPEIYDEIARKIMFETNRNVALTDLRGLFLAAHLQLPILTYDKNLIDRVSDEIGIQSIQSFETHTNQLVIRKLLELYREVSSQYSKFLQEQLENGGNLPKAMREIRKAYKEKFKTAGESALKTSREQSNPRILEFQYIGWAILSSIREYYEENIIQEDLMREICERGILLIANPPRVK